MFRTTKLDIWDTPVILERKGIINLAQLYMNKATVNNC